MSEEFCPSEHLTKTRPAPLNKNTSLSGWYFCLVEHSGLEPLTSTLPVSRSSQMS